MDQNNVLRRTFATQRKYHDLYEQYLLRGINCAINPEDPENPFDAPWKMTHYWHQGADALNICLGALIQNRREPPKAILDLPCGSGRVTRHFRAFFPEATIVACDLYDYHYNWCAQHFGAIGQKSTEHFKDLNFDVKFDLVFCGSLLTHLPEDDYKAAIDCIVRSLSDNGIAIITLQGRHAEWIQEHKYQFIEPELFKIAMKSVPKTGFGYVDYNQHWLDSVWKEQSHYGVAMVRPHFATKHIEEDYSVRILGYIERAWDDSQDALIIGKPGVNYSAPKEK
ncbi:MAG: class I SAM-dependent methyltransferase [Clostridia bacterium]|nr:class I SAM-dependent methyltransferase [Caulobacteraceae bacterium]MBQ8109226.1 class I SAM-dependent methyltransferase [Clostridia bacterium]